MSAIVSFFLSRTRSPRRVITIRQEIENLEETFMASKNEWDIVVVGGSYTDYMAHGPRLPKTGETVEGDTFLLRIPVPLPWQ